MGKQRCIKIYPNATYDDKRFKIEGNNIIDGKNKIGFKPSNVIKENKPKQVFWRGREDFILFMEGATKAMEFKEKDDSMQTHWNKEEAKSFVKKMVALASVEIKPIKLWQFAVILILLAIILIAVIRLSLVFPIG